MKRARRARPIWPEGRCLPGRPTEVAAAEKVEVKMGNRFSAVRSVVDDQSVSVWLQFQLAGDFLGGREEVAENFMMFRRDSGMSGMVLLGNQQNVDGGLRGDIAKSEDVVVLVDDVSLRFSGDDPFEDRFRHGAPYQMVSSRSWGLKLRARARIKWTISSLSR